MSAKDSNKVKKKIEFVAPDGGWGYMIAIAVIINIVSLNSKYFL